MLRELDYQARVLDTFDDYLTDLAEAKRNADQIARLAREKPDLGIEVPDHAAKAWEAMKEAGRLPASRANVPFSPRFDGVGRAVPNVVFKVPTGGGKTFLATSALSRLMGRYLGRNSGFVLWVVPNEAIYSQTLKSLKDREHPYRQELDRAAAGRVKILEKNDPLHARDVESHLCVMLLMLQSAVRSEKKFLKLFQDRGDVHGFFPPEGDQAAHQAAMEQTPNLDAYNTSMASGSLWPMVKDSLGNALRIIRPIVVMDEGHKAVSDLAFRTLYGFNPSFVLELTATPKDMKASTGKKPRNANVLVEVLGTELDLEGMIKMPLNLSALQHDDWRATLGAALERLNGLDAAARQHHANGGPYIRPIMLVQVERTGADQRDGSAIHALDAKDWLAEKGGLDPDGEIAIKTADTNELSQPENQDLLSPTNRVRVIITKQALQEGWDCPFAYVLCSLAASSSLSGMTQLVGRILRQPHALKTHVDELDECYVLTHHADTAEVVRAVKGSLEQDGLGDLVRQIQVDDAASTSNAPRPIPRREAFQGKAIYLPRVLVVSDEGERELDYETDVLYQLDWTDTDPAPLVERIPENVHTAESQLQRIRLTDEGGEHIVSEQVAAAHASTKLDPAHMARLISDIVPNAWIARDIVGKTLDGLRQRGFSEERLGQLSGLITSELRSWLATQRDVKAEQLFRDAVEEGTIQFRLRADRRNWRMPDESISAQPDNARQLVRSDGTPLQKSLFAPQYEADFNLEERSVAVHLDADQALRWWHRNVARQQYAVQGWRRNKIYPDFIFAVENTETAPRIVVLETKGDHLAGSDDTTYKANVLELMTRAFEIDGTPSGTLELVHQNGTVVQCELMLIPRSAVRFVDMR